MTVLPGTVVPGGAVPGSSSAASEPAAPAVADPAAAESPADTEPVAVRQARAQLTRLAGADLATRIAGYDEVHRLLRESLTALDAGAVRAPSGAM
jgi:hypothetical protein